jgi:hypothetical protein
MKWYHSRSFTQAAFHDCLMPQVGPWMFLHGYRVIAKLPARDLLIAALSFPGVYPYET